MRLHLHGRRLLKGIGNVEVHELLYDDHGPRPMRNQPKTHTQRQWTVIPTMGFGGGGSGTAVAGATTLRRVGNYELEELLGSGGMGDVYKARHVQFGRVRAVKVIKQQFLAAEHTEVVRRFYNEIKAVGRLEHKNIVVAIDSSSPDDKVHYLVMEYVDGVSLDELVAQHGPLPAAEACEIIRQAARGLQYIHKNDMVHRDIKPSNLMVTLVDGDQVHSDSSLTQAEGERPVVKILDLGLALLADEGTDRLTRLEQKAMGTGMYMPPEQWKTTSVDIRADIYSLGCTLYHLLAGNPPFYDSDLRPEKAHEKSAVPPIRSRVQPVPKKLWDVLRKMLEKRPEDRYATPAEVSAALAPFAEGNQLAALVRGYEAGHPASAVTPTLPNGASKVDTHRTRPWFSTAGLLGDRRRVMNWLTPLALMAVFAGGAWWIIRDSRAERQRLANDARIADEQRLENTRTVLASYAKTAALNTAAEMDKRFKVLEAESRDPELIRILNALNAGATGEAQEELYVDLRTWLIDVADRHGRELDPESWFVQDLGGTQVARSPQDPASYLKSYRHRDYFHGLGEDRDPADAAALAAVTPIEHHHLSSIYRSTATGLMKIAFSVPVRDFPAGAGSAATPGEVIGVLAMSVNVHEFTVLDQSQAGGSEVVLIDLRKDWIDGENRGLILHHPKLAKGKLARADQALLAKIDAAKPLAATPQGEDNFLVGYRDPIDPADGQTYLGAIEPVRYELHSRESDEATTERFGWIVLVQRSMQAK
jgi:serine/threonine protein kinase